MIVLVNSTHADLCEEFGVPKTTLLKTLNVIFTPLKCTSTKHLWVLIVIGDSNKEIFREVIRIIKTNLLLRST